MIYVSHGEKGGVGKSRLAMVLVDYLLTNGRPVVVVEGDKTGADVGIRFIDQVEVGFINLNRPDEMEEAFTSLFGWIEEHASEKDVVVNLPGQASSTLDQFGDLFVGTGETLGHEVTVFYSLGPLDLHTANLEISMKRGILSFVPLDRRIVVMSEKISPISEYHWTGSTLRKNFLEAGIKERVMPVLKPDYMEKKIRDLEGSYSALLSPQSPLTIAERAVLFRWLRSAHQTVQLKEVIDGK